jgi:hypothetical protein
MEHTLGHPRLPLPRPGWRPRLDGWPFLLGSAVVALVAAQLVAMGYGFHLLAAAVALAGLVAIIARPDLVLLGWLVLLVGYGRDFSHLNFGPLYISEILLAGLFLSVLLRWLFGEPLTAGVKLCLAVSAILLTVGIGGLIGFTTLSDPLWMREFVIVAYSLAAAVGAYMIDKPGFAKRLLIALVLGSVIGVVVALKAYAQGEINVTSTGAIRIAPIQFGIAFGVTPLLLIALVRERLARPRILVAIVPFLICLLLVNHRSAWIGFAVGLALLLGTRRSASGRLALVAGAATGLLFLGTVYALAPESDIGKAGARALTITSTEDPNAEYRLEFWDNLFKTGIRSPFGAGFDPYPEEWVPKNTVVGEEENPAPHNSWLALLYKIGPLFLGVLLAVLAVLGLRAFRLEHSEEDPRRRVQLVVLGASLGYLIVLCAFNAALEVPYIALPFWLLVGFVAGTVLREPSSQPARAYVARRARTSGPRGRAIEPRGT